MGIEWIILLLLFVEYSIFLPKIFAKAGITETWKGYIPVYNLMVMIKVTKKPWWWILFLLAPGVNLLMLMAMNLELARSFKLFKPGDTLLAIFLPHVTLAQIALKDEIKYEGASDWKNEKHREIRKISDMIVLALVSVGIFNVAIALYKLVGAKDKPGHKTIVKEWGDALLFAIVAASIIRTFFLEAFKIPTPSMEKNLLVGDFLFVSKISYGPKIPQTPIAFPFVHHTMPLIETKSYLDLFTLPYYRLPGMGDVQRNDVVVFNFPAGDSVQLDRQNETYYQIVIDNAFRTFFLENKERFSKESHKALLREFYLKKGSYMKRYRDQLIETGNLTKRPVDKEDHYIKRCVAVAGDVLEVKNRELYVNGQKSGNTPKMEFNYSIKTQDPIVTQDQLNEFVGLLRENLDIASSDFSLYEGSNRDGNITLPNDKVEEGKKAFVLFQPNNRPAGSHDSIFDLESYATRPDYNRFFQYYPVFPNSPDYDWSNDNFGPLTIPKQGETVKLDMKNIALYKRIINVYEHNDLKIKGNDILINGKKATSYTFKQDYYWLMGDNRQNSLDSRYWGFVPEDHVVGKGVLVWFSSDPEGGVRWNRVFKLIK